MSYRKEATTRIIYLSAAFALALIAGVIVAGLVAIIFPDANHSSRYKVPAYICFGVFAVVCGILVHKVDQILNKRYNSNP
jgi:MFS family permease